MKITNSNIYLLMAALFLFGSCGGFDHVEKVKITNSVSKETIYLKYYAWGLGHQINVISLNKKSVWPDSSKDYSTKSGAYFYKLQRDSLFLYGVWDASKLNVVKDFKTKIVFKELQNYESIELCKTYKEKGMNIFPPSYAEVAKNFAASK